MGRLEPKQLLCLLNAHNDKIGPEHATSLTDSIDLNEYMPPRFDFWSLDRKGTHRIQWVPG